MNKRQYKKKQRQGLFYLNRNKYEKRLKKIMEDKERKFYESLGDAFVRTFSEEEWEKTIKRL